MRALLSVAAWALFAAAAFGEDVASLVKSAAAKIEARDLDGAVADCTKALEIDPRSAPAYRTRAEAKALVGSSRVDLQACKLEYSIVSPK